MPNPYHLNVESVAEGADRNALERPGVMDAFRKRVDNFWNMFRTLDSQSNQVPEKLRGEYNDLMQRGGRIRATIEYVTSTYDAVAEWVSDIFGFSGTDVGLDGVMWRDVPNGNLGAIQFVPLAVIAGASTLIVKWLKDAYTMERKLSEYQKLQEQGYDANRAAEIVNQTVTGPGLFNLGLGGSMKPLLWIGGIGVGFWIAKRQGWI